MPTKTCSILRYKPYTMSLKRMYLSHWSWIGWAQMALYILLAQLDGMCMYILLIFMW